jgi:hypothetical protein
MMFVAAAARVIGWLFAPFVLLGALAGAGLGYLYVASRITPAQSAEALLPELDATIKLKFYYSWGDNDSGRYISVTDRNGNVRGKIDGWDWAHHARTSIYATPEGNLAILGPAQSDYLVDRKTLQLKNLWGAGKSSEIWKYLGAFDFQERSLHFFPAADQKECIPMLMEYDPDPSLPRSQYRRQGCDRTSP